MTREEAINIIRDTYYPETELKALEVLIPELRESEDERIRKEMIEFIQWCEDRGFTRHDFHQAKRPSEWIAYLEKQKEQKPAEWSEEEEQLLNTWLFIIDENEWRMDANFCEDTREFIARLKSLRPQPKQEWSEDIIQKAVKEVGLTQHQIDWFKTNVFPPKQEWSEADEKMRNRIIGHLSGFFYPNYLYGEDAEECIDWLKSLHYLPNWKPSEPEKGALETAIYVLREENFPKAAEHLQDILNAFEQMSDYKVGDKISWKGKEYTIDACYPQPKQEWSEEDEDRIRQIERIAPAAGCTQKLQEEIHDWFKSLRNRVNSPKSNTNFPWTPSEEHLSALLAIINDPNNIWSQTCQLALSDLYEQLERLKKFEDNANEDNT